MKYDNDTIYYASRTAQEELADVMTGVKPSALGFWETIPECLFKRELVPIDASYYKWAVAKDEDGLFALVDAYYMPHSPARDWAVGKALGYSDASIKNYIQRMKYPKHHRFSKWRKIIATAQRFSWMTVLTTWLGSVLRVPILRNICLKEGF